MTPPVAIAVVSWNTRDLLDACLESMRPDAEAGRARVWVVDNASTDGSAGMVAERHPWAELVALEENIGFGRAVNLVADRAPGALFVAPANADVALEPGALEKLLDAAAADPEAGALAPRLILPGGETQHSVHPFPSVPFALAFDIGLFRVSGRLADRWCIEGGWNPDRPRRVPWALGAFLLVRREAWDAVGGFDEAQWMYAEDLDLGWRLARAGWPTRYVPDAPVRHESAASTSQAWGAERVARWQRATYAWMLHRRGPAVTRAVAGIHTLGAGTRWAVRKPLAHLRPLRFKDEADYYLDWAKLHSEGLRSRAKIEAGR